MTGLIEIISFFSKNVSIENWQPVPTVRLTECSSHGELQRSVWFPAWANTQSGRWEWRKAKRGGFEARVSHCLRTAWEVHSG